jgi:hypothetical protein
MAKKTVLALIALLLVAMGGATTYLALSIPNDVRAEAALRQARDELNKGDRDAARQRLRSVVEQHPRTDGAATAINILFTMAEQDRARLMEEIEELRKQRDRDRKIIAELASNVSQNSRQTAAAAAEASAARQLAAQRPRTVQKAQTKTKAKAKPKPRATPRRKR